ncbi:MAG: tetratricopeptide repeat protein [Acidobacteriota bacterium]|nr:tetratricopeptide repeat protein [Acidobacteriota bacterium]
MKRNVLFAVALLAIAGRAQAASWYDEYNDGIKAVSAGRWQVVIQKMTAAIAGKPKEDDNARSYGNIFINYHPYYYRGVAYLRTGKYDQAIIDFEKTSGPGESDQGSIVNLMQEAKLKQAQATTPEPVPQPVPVPVPVPQPPVRPTPQPPATPTIDPALRQQVNTAINSANQSLAGARARKAGSSQQYQQALNAMADANQKVATAKTNDDLQAALASASNAKLYADSAMPPNVPPLPVPPTKPIVAAGDVLGDTAKRLRSALENYFSGEFETASVQFTRLSQEMPRNGWIWAFLGASQYSRYAFEADESYKSQAMQSFRKAKQYRSWKNGLPQKYFSKRIRNVFLSAS